MSINFNRNRTQMKYEDFIGVSSPEELPQKKAEFKRYSLTDNDVADLKRCLQEDALDFFFNGIVSFSEGIDGVFERRFSWATIKLYYSVFYMLRATLASKDYAILQNGNVFRLHLKSGESPYATNNSKYKSTHQGTISHYIDIFENNDILLTNKINGVSTYEWMEEVRNIINYRSVSFEEPNCLNCWERFDEAIGDGNLKDLLDNIEKDLSFIYCFQEEYSVVALPFKRLILTIQDFSTAGLLERIMRDRLDYSKMIFNYDERELNILKEIFG